MHIVMMPIYFSTMSQKCQEEILILEYQCRYKNCPNISNSFTLWKNKPTGIFSYNFALQQLLKYDRHTVILASVMAYFPLTSDTLTRLFAIQQFNLTTKTEVILK